MSLKNRINEAFKDAMRKKEKARLNALKLLRNEIKLKEKSSKAELDDGEILRLLAKQIKQRDESIAQYNEAGRDDLAAEERAEKEALAEFMPRQLTDDELGEVLSRIIAATGASSPKDMGRVMKAAMAELAGKADGKKVSEMVRARLA